ncbi:DUF1700 domain-containing protein [uncultured Massilia sp.]|uniref:DUF1700 domain-containing protein n=1 Tax=uncultured Massilia sp. TaxID=169973 RepID=UPI0025D93D51|nr:DUF1700 domain-containing protein [uncultured Massilia sp.]
MGKLDYLDALKRAMLGLAPDVQARTLAYYEQRFVDGAIAGRSEADVAAELDDPRKIAMTLRASAHMNTLAERKHPARTLRVLVSAAGLAIFNLFMIVPAIVYSALLFALYVCALCFYLAGIATTASGLAGANELVLDWPSRLAALDEDGHGERQTRIVIGDHGINVRQDRPRGAARAAAASAGATADAHAEGDAADDEPARDSRVLRGAEAVADSTLRISTDMDAESRTTQTLLGIAMVLGGIALCLAALVVTRYTWVGLKRYLQMNRSLLKGS